MDTVLNIPLDVDLGHLIGLTGIVMSMYFYRRARQIKRLSYSIITFRHIRKYVPGDIQLYYKGVASDKINVSAVYIINDGTLPIGTSDITDSDPVRLVFGERSKPLGFTIEHIDNPHSRWSFEFDTEKKSILLGWDFINQDEGAFILVYHDSDPQDNLNIVGTVIGSPRIQRRSSGLLDLGVIMEAGFFSFFAIIIGASLIMGSIANQNISIPWGDGRIIFIAAVMLFFGGYLWAGITVLPKLRSKSRRAAISYCAKYLPPLD